jgi:hypothetical protein
MHWLDEKRVSEIVGGNGNEKRNTRRKTKVTVMK